MEHINLSALYGPDVAQVSTVCQAIRDQGSRAPDSPALVWRDEEISYEALIARADRIRPQIHVADRSPVAVRMERGPLLVATLFAVLETGAPYLALAPDWPVQRCRQAMAQAGAQICLHDGSSVGSAFQDLPGLILIDPDRDMLDTSSGSIQTPAPGDGCAVFYTSGSTGTPKSVLSPHAGIFRIAHDPTLAYDRTTRTLQAAPLGWDAFSLELWAPLLRGGSCLLYDGAYLSPQDVRAAVQKYGVNTLWLTSSLFSAFIDDDPGCLQGLRLLMIGGERLSPRHVARCLKLLPDVRLINGYGPVEATVFVSAYDIPDGADTEQDLSIGTPVAGTTVYLLDGDYRITKAGEPGQVAAAGAGLALGYLGDSEATQRLFPVLPLGSGGAPVRVYLTGDIGRVEKDGTLTFLGRLDRQVKIRGARVDPIEVERVIEKIAGVSRAVVVPLPLDTANKECLAAFCTTETGATPTEAEIRSGVAEALPPACVPLSVRLLTVLPLTATGKVDTRQLVADLRGESEPAPPAETATGHMKLVQELLTSLLGHAVPDEEDLFLAGATSLTAIRLAAQLQNACGVHLSVAKIMSSRTPAGVAQLLANAGRAQAAAGSI
ncbi:Phenylalanine racemase (ATP-hydrolyzing) [Actinobacteria bacterium OV450]|nr:Phenylalanine racemase (ATP-hydrolyzing) [Actinobacteria bacterium OV450]